MTARVVQVVGNALLVGAAIGLLAGVAVASGVTLLELVDNPGGVFRSEGRIDGAAVLETWVSWWWATTLVVAGPAMLVDGLRRLFVQRRRERGRS